MGKGSDGKSNKIDQFTVMLLMSPTSNLTLYPGVNNTAVINLSYQIHCMNLANCPVIYLAPKGKSSTTFIYYCVETKR